MISGEVAGIYNAIQHLAVYFPFTVLATGISSNLNMHQICEQNIFIIVITIIATLQQSSLITPELTQLSLVLSVADLQHSFLVTLQLLIHLLSISAHLLLFSLLSFCLHLFLAMILYIDLNYS